MNAPSPIDERPVNMLKPVAEVFSDTKLTPVQDEHGSFALHGAHGICFSNSAHPIVHTAVTTWVGVGQ